MVKGVHQRSLIILYNHKGKVRFLMNSYHNRGELKLKLLNFERSKTMRWPNILSFKTE